MDRGRRIGRGEVPQIPEILAIGDYQLDVATITRKGRWNGASHEFRNVAGTAWLHFPCGGPIIHPPFVHLSPGLTRLAHRLEVVPEAGHAQTEIGIVDALRITPDARIGETLDVALDVRASALQDIVQLGEGILGWHKGGGHEGQVLVSFEAETLQVDVSKPARGRILAGVAVYPAKPIIPSVLHVVIDGFDLVISSLKVTPKGAIGSVTVRLPGGIASPSACEPAELDLGEVPLGPGCELYVDRPDDAYGPWLIADTGLEMEGRGFILDLSTTRSPSGRPPTWRGLQLATGSATGRRLVPDPCNTGYLRGSYAFTNATVNAWGLDATLILDQPCTFEALNPRGQIVTVSDGWLEVTHSIVSGGELGPGTVSLPTDAVCAGVPGAVVAPRIVAVSVQADLDVAGTVDNQSGPMAWGELTHHGKELIAWLASFEVGYLYLPAGPRASYTPETAGGFVGPSMNTIVDASLADLEAHAVAGVTFPYLRDVAIFSPDHPGGSGSPYKLPWLGGWLRVGHLGVDGELITYNGLSNERIGEPARSGYVGGRSFRADLFVNDKRNLLAEFITSAIYDSNFGGRLQIPKPCDIAALTFAKMQLTSTAHLVGGDVALPPGGVPLAYWSLQLVPTGSPAQAGVVSARTGRIVFLAAGIAEPVHFAEPFGLTWGEMLARGDLGELFLDFNNYGQRFDGLTYNPRAFRLADADPPIPDPYLATSGTVVFPFFGVHPLNIRDATDPITASPFFSRRVTVPKAPLVPGWPATDLALAGTWKDIVSNDLAVFACPDVQVDYNDPGQDGFLGTGSADIGFFHSDGLDVLVDIHGGATDIRMSSSDTHDIDIGLFARLSGIAEISGCARIEGPLLTRMSFYGLLEQSAAAGSILGPKVGYAVDIDINVTPTSFDFYASGDMLLAVGGVEVEVSASVHLLADFATHAAEGELIGRINCDAILVGLSGEGQITWHADPAMHYLQGRMKVSVCSWVVSGGLEGGFFVGESVPANLAWVLQPTNPHFGITTMILPPTLTGIFGYGQISFGVNWYVLGGGVDLYVAMGAFLTIPAGGLTAIVGAGLPYVVGACGVYVHGEILGGLVSASAWANLAIRGPIPLYFDYTIGLEGCVAWVLCASVTLNAGLDSSGFYLN
jgi:hypothetical protein